MVVNQFLNKFNKAGYFLGVPRGIGVPGPLRFPWFHDQVTKGQATHPHADHVPPLRSKGWIAGLTPPKFNIAPENGWLEDYFPFGMVTFQGLC